MSGSAREKYCDSNPDQSVNNSHCMHPVSTHARPWKNGEAKTHKICDVTSQCCWCGATQEESETRPVLHGDKARVMRTR